METPNRPGSEGAPLTGVPGDPTGLIDTGRVENRDMISALLDTLGALVVVLDDEGRILRFNRACERTTGYSTEEVVGRRVWDLFLTPQDVEPAKAIFEELAASELSKEHETVWLTREGEARLIAWSNTAVYGDEGEVTYVIATGIDITDQKQAQEALRRSEERYALAEQAANIGSWDWNIRTGDLHWSHQTEPLFGLGPGEFGRTYAAFIECVHPDDRQHVVDATNAAVAADAEYAIEHRIVWPDGTVRWVSETGDVIRDESGAAARMLGVVQDITQRKEAQERIEEQNRFLTSILESVTHPLYVVDVDDYSVQLANTAAYRGHLPEGATCYELFHGLSKPCPESGYPCPLEGIKKTKTTVTAEHVHHGPDGSRPIVEVLAYPLLDDEGEVTAVIEYCLDITERKEMEEALREAKATAERARREERRRRQEAERRRQIAESLTTVLAALNSNQPVDDVLDYIAEQAIVLLDTQAVGIYQLTGDPETLVVRAGRCLPPESGNGAQLPAGTEALERAIQLRQVVRDPDLTADPAAPAAASCGGSPFGALLAAPIILQDEVYGGAVLYYSRPHSFSDEDVELATVLSNQIAQAVENAELREQIAEAAATAERNRLARDLHDSVTQALFSASLVAETLPRVWQRDPDEAKAGLEELRDLTQGALAEMRSLLLELRPSAVLECRLDDLLVELSRAITSRAQLPVVTKLTTSPALPPDVQVAFYRVAQEALNNAVKHAEASELTVSLEVNPPVTGQQEDGWQGQVELRVSDDGRGFQADSTPASHFGLGIIRERAQAIGASLSIETQVDEGTDVILAWEGDQV